MVSHNLSTPDGSTQHTQKKQMEILQARTASGSLQVVRAQTVQTTSSRWSSSTLHSEICSNGVSTSTTSTSSSSFSNGHSIPAITANSTSSSHRTSALTTNGFSSHHPSEKCRTANPSTDSHSESNQSVDPLPHGLCCLINSGNRCTHMHRYCLNSNATHPRLDAL